MAWTPYDLKQWRSRLHWTQARAADALCFHLQAYKKLECGTRMIVPRVQLLCELLERQHVRVMHSVAGEPGARQLFATPDTVLERMDALELEGRLVGVGGRPLLRYVTLFSGIEAATAAFERIGADALPVAFCEIDPAANAVLRYRWPDIPRIGDVTSFDWSRLRGRVDCVLAGPPCQSFSSAGKRRGLSDPRGSLSLHALRAIGAMQPRYFVIENVPGFRTTNGGEAFDAFEEEAGRLGYAVAHNELNAKNFGVPQDRRRLWLVGEHSRTSRGPREILDLQQGEGRPEIARGTGWQTPARHFEGSSGDLIAPQGGDIDWSDPVQWTNPSERAEGVDPGIPVPWAGGKAVAGNFRNSRVSKVAPCLQTKSNSLNSNPSVLIETEGKTIPWRFTPKECLRLQGFDDDWFDGPLLNRKPLSEPERYRLAGNSWPVPVAAWILSGLVCLFHGPILQAIAYVWRRRMPFVFPPRPAAAIVQWDGDPNGLPFPGAGGKRATGDIAGLLEEAASGYRMAA